MTIENNITITNVMSDRVSNIALHPILIHQNSQGIPSEVDLKESQQNRDSTNIFHSCTDWLTLSTSALVLNPLQSGNVSIRAKIPLNARGFYYAGVLALEEKPGTGNLAINVQFRFITLVMITVQGPMAKQNIKLTGAEMHMTQATAKRPISTLLSINIDNHGESFARVQGTAVVSYQVGDKWRRLTQVDFKEQGIFPATILSPSIDLKRALPSGHYKVSGQLFVDNRPGGKLDQEIDYAGDPSVSTLTADVNLSVKPTEAIIQVTPGGQRSLVLTVQNPSDDTVDLFGSLQLPEALQPKDKSDIRGELYNCAKWMSLTPERISLRAQGRASIRLTCNLPIDTATLPHAYSQVLLQWKYPNGTIAGEMVVPITINIPSKTADEVKAISQQIDLTQQQDNKYAIMAKFINAGNTDFSATATATAQTGIGNVVLSAALGTTTLRVLPMGVIQFSGELDFTTVKPGVYALTVYMKYGDKETATAQLSIRVEEKDGQKNVSIIETPTDNVKPAINIVN